MYVTGYYTTVSMAIIWKHHLPPVISVSRKRCIPSSSTSNRQHGGRWGGIKVTQLDHVESKAEQHTRVSSLTGGSPFIEMTHLGWNLSYFSRPWRGNNQFLTPLHTIALTESTREGFNWMFFVPFPPRLICTDGWAADAGGSSLQNAFAKRRTRRHLEIEIQSRRRGGKRGVLNAERRYARPSVGHGRADDKKGRPWSTGTALHANHPEPDEGHQK